MPVRRTLTVMEQRADALARGPAHRARAARAGDADAPVNAHAGVTVRLGTLVHNGVAPSLYAVVDRGAIKRPRVARSLRGEIALRYDEPFAPTRIAFDRGDILVEDLTPAAERAQRPDLTISGPLPQVSQLTAVPLWAGLPRATDARARLALRRIATGTLRIEGSRMLARRLMQLLEL